MRFPGFSLHQFFVRLHFYCFSQFLEFLLAVNLVNALFFCLSVCLLWVLGWKKFKLHAVHLSCSPPCRHLLHVHDCWTVYAEALSEETPGHQRERLHRLRLPRRCHLLFCAGSGKCTHTIQNLSYALWSKNTDFLIVIVLCFFSSQVFGRDNTAFWIVFSVIHILATLLLSTQLYYMGRWRLSKITERKQTQSSGLYWLKMSHVRLITDCN